MNNEVKGSYFVTFYFTDQGGEVLWEDLDRLDELSLETYLNLADAREAVTKGLQACGQVVEAVIWRFPNTPIFTISVARGEREFWIEKEKENEVKES